MTLAVRSLSVAQWKKCWVDLFFWGETQMRKTLGCYSTRRFVLKVIWGDKSAWVCFLDAS